MFVTEILHKKMNNFFQNFIIILICVCASSTQTFAIGLREFQSIEKISQTILNNYSRYEYVYLGIGRGPTPIIAYLETEPDTVVHNVPLTATNSLGSVVTYSMSNRVEFHSCLSPTQCEGLNQYLDEAFPSTQKRDGKRKILLIDYACGGNALACAQHFFVSYAVDRDIDVEFQTFAITDKGNSSRVQSVVPGVDIFELDADRSDQTNFKKNDPLFIRMAAKLTREFSEFYGFNPLTSSHYDLTRRPQYAQYLEEIKEAKLSPEKLTEDNEIESLLWWGEWRVLLRFLSSEARERIDLTFKKLRGEMKENPVLNPTQRSFEENSLPDEAL